MHITPLWTKSSLWFSECGFLHVMLYIWPQCTAYGQLFAHRPICMCKYNICIYNCDNYLCALLTALPFFFFFATEFLTVPIQMILLIKLSGFVERAKVLNNLALPPLSSSCILKIPFKLSIFILQLYRNAYFLFFFLIKRNNTAPSDRRARWPNPSFSSPTSMILWFIKQFMFLWAKSMGKIISSNQIKSSAPDENTFG